MNRLFAAALLGASMLTSLAASAQEPFKIGLILPMTGPSQSTGKQINAAVNLFVQQNGDVVAGRKIEVILRDDAGVADTTKRVAQELLVKDRVNALAGFGLTPLALSTAPLATQAKVPMVVMSAASKFGRGNSTKDAFRGPGINNWDMSLMKNFKWHEGTRNVQFRFETYNSFNHTQFGGATGTGTSVDTVARFDAAGRQVNTRFGQYLASRDGRRVQLGLKFSF